MNPPLLFRRAQPWDASLLSAIAYAGKQHWGYPQDWMEGWREELKITPEYIRKQPVFVAKQAGKIVGFYGLKRQAGALYLEHFWLRPAWIGRGLGRALFAGAVAQASQASASELLIKADPHAVVFYLKMGAIRTGQEAYLHLGQHPRVVPLLTYFLS